MITFGLLQADTGRITVGQFKGQVFMWEVIFSIVVFVGILLILRSYQRRSDKVKSDNRKFKGPSRENDQP